MVEAIEAGCRREDQHDLLRGGDRDSVFAVGYGASLSGDMQQRLHRRSFMLVPFHIRGCRGPGDSNRGTSSHRYLIRRQGCFPIMLLGGETHGEGQRPRFVRRQPQHDHLCRITNEHFSCEGGSAYRVLRRCDSRIQIERVAVIGESLMAREVQLKVGQRLIKLGIWPLHTAHQLVCFHIIRNRQRRPCSHQGLPVLRIFEVFRPRSRPEGRVVQRNHFGPRPSEDLRPKPPVADGKGRSEVPGIVGRRGPVDHLQCVPCTGLLREGRNRGWRYAWALGHGTAQQSKRHEAKLNWSHIHERVYRAARMLLNEIGSRQARGPAVVDGSRL
jgi:hypothetical protein